MALNFDKIISETENVSLEDLCIESLVQADLDPNSITFNDLFEDNLLAHDQINNIKVDLSDHCFFDVDVDCTDIDKVWISDCDISDSFQFEDLNIVDFEPNKQHNISDNEDSFTNDDTLVNETSDLSKKGVTIRRQSTRIQNQTRKKIAEQIQRENIRLAKEAQLLNNKKYSKKKNNHIPLIDEKLNSPAMQRYLLMPTDLDAEDDEEEVDNAEVTSDDDPNKLWCICRQPYGDRFMICCDNCMEWYHGDCVGVTQKEGSDMDEFTCPKCVANSSTTVVPKKREDVVIIDDDEEEDNDDELLCIDDEDCLITKSVEPVKFNANIFQLIKKDQVETNKPDKLPSEVNVPSLSNRTSVCLNQGCKTLVNPKKSLYCSRPCIDKYTKMVIKNNLREKANQYGLPKGPKLAKMTRFVLAQPATETIQDEITAPTEENLKEFLLKNPTYKVYQSSIPIKSKQNQEKSKKFLELINKDPSKHIKIVKHFATLFKKSMSLKSFNAEFQSIWKHCVQMEDGVFEACDKMINDKYMTKVKELSECLKKSENSKLCSDIIHDRLLIPDLLSMNKDQLEARSKIIVVDDVQVSVTEKQDMFRKTFSTSTGSVSLLSDTTHLHSRHLYDIKCKICNGAAKLNHETKTKEKEHQQTSDAIIPPLTIDISNQEKVPSPSNNDEFKVTSSVKTPDMVVDMDICSTPSEKEEVIKVNETIPDSKQDKVSSDQRKLNDIDKSTKTAKRKLSSLWEGCLTYKEVGSVDCKSYLVTRYFLNKPTEEDKEFCSDNDEDIRDNINLNSSIDSQMLINGRSEMKQVQEYLRRLRKHSNKEFLVLRLHPTNLVEGRQTYLTMFEYLHSRERCGVVKQGKPGVKDCFVYPLNAHSTIPSIFLPFIGPGLEKKRPHLLLLLIVRNPLAKVLYQPISPKYDQEHDFVKKHGINLDKYYQPNPNPPFCPSPIANENDVANYVLSQRSLVEKEMFEAAGDIKDKYETDNYQSELEVVTTINGIKIDTRKELEEFEASKDEIKVTEEKKDTGIVEEHTPVDTNQNAASSCPKPSVSEPLIHLSLDIPLPPERKPDPKALKVPKSSINLPDPSLLPQPFVYRSHPKCVTKAPSEVPPVTRRDQSPSYSIKKEHPIANEHIHSNHHPVIVGNHGLPLPSTLYSPNKDIDFRLTALPAPQDIPAKVVDIEIMSSNASSQNPYLKRKDSSRFYTYYDSFVSEAESAKRRRAYFFNPRYPDSANAVLKHIQSQLSGGHRSWSMIVPTRSTNVSTFSPPPPDDRHTL